MITLKEIRKEVRESFACLDQHIGEISRGRIDFEDILYEILFIFKNLSIYVTRYYPMEFNKK
jgi:hypothetical protein